ncbi:hypothetical protein MLD38_037801 [Melastoma candidum]|uniref:Uncharacterized protein n=1 Tax=Melastoma candidum TaxID=119954 RepID=A0ACB9LN61_9MYRT|nr:hypothetical protein MLD38_037801 [Melastoma candidum]
MAESTVNFVVDKLWLFLENKIKLFKGSHKEVVMAKEELKRTQVFQRIADPLMETDEEVRVWFKQLRECAVIDRSEINDENQTRETQTPRNLRGSAKIAYIHGQRVFY